MSYNLEANHQQVQLHMLARQRSPKTFLTKLYDLSFNKCSVLGVLDPFANHFIQISSSEVTLGEDYRYPLIDAKLWNARTNQKK